MHQRVARISSVQSYKVGHDYTNGVLHITTANALQSIFILPTLYYFYYCACLATHMNVYEVSTSWEVLKIQHAKVFFAMLLL
jgi:hypothetical protein